MDSLFGNSFGTESEQTLNPYPLTRLTFIYLKAFVATGGIEKVNRALLKAAYDLELQGKWQIFAVSPYSKGADERYFPASKLVGFRGARWKFMLYMMLRPPRTDVLLVGHINLAPAALLLHWRYPGLKIALMAHGIEVWQPLGRIKRWLLHRADLVLSVSDYTRSKLLDLHGLPPSKIQVLPNCLDPFFSFPAHFQKPDYLLQRYGLQPAQKVLLTVSRLNGQEGYKGYDQVLKALPLLNQAFSGVHYILAGQYDEEEKTRLEAIITEHGLQNRVHMPGFLPDAELTDHYLLADVFVMPSKKEGFGLVFMEAMACGTPAIGGNQDGSPEALRPGELGVTTHPEDPAAIARTIEVVLSSPPAPETLQQKTKAVFGFEYYPGRLAAALQPLMENA